jgi:hypothetical protein
MSNAVFTLVFMGSFFILIGIGAIIYFHYFPEEKGEEEVSTE